jgi:hypothetical protein
MMHRALYRELTIGCPNRVRLPLLFLFLAVLGARADTLTFIATPDSSGNTNVLWSNPANWYAELPDGLGLTNANRIPAPEDCVIVNSASDAASNTVNLASLDVIGQINGGNFLLPLLTTDNSLNGIVFNGSTVQVTQQLYQNGPISSLSNTKLSIGTGALALLPSTPTHSGGLSLLRTSIVDVLGQVILDGRTNSARLSGDNTSALHLWPGSTLTAQSVGNRGVTLSSLLIDNEGTVRCAGGTLVIGDAIGPVAWTSSGGTGNFDAADTNATISYASLIISNGLTFNFTGPGLHQWRSPRALTVNGTLNLGALDPATQPLDSGRMEVLDILGNGTTHVIGPPGTNSSVLTARGGTLTGQFLIDPGAQFVLASVQNLQDCTLTNSGQTILAATAGISFAENSSVYNLTGGVFEIQGESPIVPFPGTTNVAFNNSGSLQRSTGSGTSVLWVPLNNQGEVEVLSGTLGLGPGSSSGHFHVATGATLAFQTGTHVLNSGASFDGPGSVRLGGDAVATLEVNGSVTVPRLTLAQNGILDGSGNLLVTEHCILNGGGNVQGIGRLTLSAGSSLELISANLRQRTIDNFGLVLWGGNCTADAGFVFNNRTGATFMASSPGGLVFSDIGSPGDRPLFANLGTFICATTNAATTLQFRFVQGSGALQLETDGLFFSSGFIQSGGVTTIGPRARLLGDSFAGGASLVGGLLEGIGTILTPVINGAEIRPGISGSPGTLTITLNNYTQMPAGALTIALGGRAPGTEYSQLVITAGNASLDGTLNVNLSNGFQPVAGDSFQILSCQALTGKFSVVNNPPLGENLALGTLYTSTGVSLLVTNIHPVGPPLSIARATNSFDSLQLAWPTVPGQDYELQYSPDLVQWFALTNLTADTTNLLLVDPTPPPLPPIRFYRVQ